MKNQYTLVLQFPEKSMEFDEMIELGDSIAKHLQDKKQQSKSVKRFGALKSVIPKLRHA